MQDRLPDLLHGRLSASDATAVQRAVDADPELGAELAMLQLVRASHVSAAPFDTGRIVRALPAPPVQVAARDVIAGPADTQVDELALRRNARRPMISQRFARAAALLVVVGGGTMLSVWNGRTPRVAPVSTPIASESIASTSIPSASGQMQLGLGASTDEMSVEALRALEADIRALDGVPSADPDAGVDLFGAEGA